jgi:TonB family protein
MFGGLVVIKAGSLACRRLASIIAFAIVLTALADAATDLQTRIGAVEVLSDTQGVDFGPYLTQAIKTVRDNWFKAMPEKVQAPHPMKGKAAIRFAVQRSGRIRGIKLVESSDNITLDRTAWAGIQASNPLPALPVEFKGDYLSVRIRFDYNQPADSSGK